MHRTLILPLALTALPLAVHAQDLSPRVMGQPVGSGLIQQQLEQPFF